MGDPEVEGFILDLTTFLLAPLTPRVARNLCWSSRRQCSCVWYHVQLSTLSRGPKLLKSTFSVPEPTSKDYVDAELGFITPRWVSGQFLLQGYTL